MKIGLVDVDSKWPNIPLMKLSAYHKGKGDEVEFANSYTTYDLVYKAKVFTFTKDTPVNFYTKELIKGGTGYDSELKQWLPPEIEHLYPDYSVYNENKTAYGFLTRGCPRGCPFCIVGRKEGLKSVKVANLNEFWNGQPHINLLDPNLLACEQRIELLESLVPTNAWINFSQGLDIRFIDEQTTRLLQKLRVRLVHFAWDRPKDEKIIVPRLKLFKEITKIDYRNACVYVLTNFESTFEEDLYRVEVIRSLGYRPYIMIYEKETASHLHKELSHYVNSPALFWTIPTFQEYKRGKINKLKSKLEYT